MKILLVDDSKSARYALRLELQRHGVEVDTAESAEAAFERLDGDLPDAILMDHMMPGLNGFEALAIIRADPRTAAIPVVMCTSHEDADFAAAAQQRGAVGILPKSAAQEKLPDLLSRLRAGSDRQPSPVRKDAAPTSPPVLKVVPKSSPEQDPNPDLSRLIERHAAGLVDARIESQVVGLIEPLLRDLDSSLSERLSAASRQLIESRLAELRDALEARLVSAGEAMTEAHAGGISAALQSAAAALVRDTLPDLVRTEIEVERAQIMDLVDQYLRESRGTAKDDRTDERLAGFDGSIAAKLKEVARREASEAAEGAAVRTQRIADHMMQQVRTSLALVYLAILGAALIGILAAGAAYFLPH